MDRGSNDKTLLEMCSIIYLPTWATPRFPRHTERSQVETWTKLDGYEASLERQTEDAKALRIAKCEIDISCSFICLNNRQAEFYFWQIHKGNMQVQNDQCLTQSRTEGRVQPIVGSSRYKKQQH